MNISKKLANAAATLGLSLCLMAMVNPCRAQTRQDNQTCFDNKVEPAQAIRACSVFISTRRAVDGGRLTTEGLASSLARRGIAYRRLDEHDSAIEDFSSSLKIRPGNGATYALRGMSYTRKREFNRALSDFEQAIRLTKGLSLAETYANRGVVYLILGEDVRANSDFENAARTEPKSARQFMDQKEYTEVWVTYLKQIQNENDYENWSGPPLNAARGSR